MPNVAVPINADGSASLNSDGSAILADPEAMTCCCGCPSELVCEHCEALPSDTPLTIGVLLPPITPVAGPQSCPGVSGGDADFEATGSFAGGEFCLTQESACVWRYEGPFDDIEVSFTSPTQDHPTDTINVFLEIGDGEWRVYAYLTGGFPAATVNSWLYDTGWVPGTPPCGAPQTIAGLDKAVCSDPGGDGESVWVADDTGDVTATPCCEPCTCDPNALASTYTLSFHYEGRDEVTDDLICEGDVTGLVLGMVFVGVIGSCLFDCENGTGSDPCPELEDCGLLLFCAIEYEISLCRWAVNLGGFAASGTGGLGPTTPADPTGAYTNQVGGNFSGVNYTFTSIVVS